MEYISKHIINIWVEATSPVTSSFRPPKSAAAHIYLSSLQKVDDGGLRKLACAEPTCSVLIALFT